MLPLLVIPTAATSDANSRRKADREQYEQDKAAIEDALEEFASEHDGHV